MSKRKKLKKIIKKQKVKIEEQEIKIVDLHYENIIMLCYLKQKGLMYDYLELLDDEELPFN